MMGDRPGIDQRIAEAEGEREARGARHPADQRKHHRQRDGRPGIKRPVRHLHHRPGEREFRRPPGGPYPPIGAGDPLVVIFPVLVERLDQVVIHMRAIGEADETAQEDRLVDPRRRRIRPPAPPARPAGLAHRDRLARKDKLGLADGPPDPRDRGVHPHGMVLPVRQQVDHHDIDMLRHLRELEPEARDIGIGNRLLHPGADMIDVADQLAHRQVAPEQHLVADDDAGDRVRMRVRRGNAGRHLARIVLRVRPEPDPGPDLQPGLFRQRADVEIALDRGIGADAAGVTRDQPQILLHLGGRGKILRQRRLAIAERRVGHRVEPRLRHGDAAGTRPVRQIPRGDAQQAEQKDQIRSCGAHGPCAYRRLHRQTRGGS